jgi:Methyltransferase domain
VTPSVPALPVDERVAREFVDGVLGGESILARCRAEVEESRLVDELQAAYEEFWAIVEPSARYNTGRLGYEEGIRLYALVRTLRPRVCVETGVCNGFSTAFLLLALARNGAGELHSIDLPEVVGADYEPGAFWAGKRGAAIPPGKEPGWMIPAHLRGSWNLTIGRSQDQLPLLLDRLGPLDLFVHDSEHSYECMSFEFRAAWPVLAEGGALVADDWNWNEAFTEFARDAERTPITLGKKLALLLKPLACQARGPESLSEGGP